MAARRPSSITREEDLNSKYINHLANQLSLDDDANQISLHGNTLTCVSTGFNAQEPDDPYSTVVLKKDNGAFQIVFGPYTGATRLEALIGLLRKVEGDMHGVISRAGGYQGGQTVGGEDVDGDVAALGGTSAATDPTDTPGAEVGSSSKPEGGDTKRKQNNNDDGNHKDGKKTNKTTRRTRAGAKVNTAKKTGGAEEVATQPGEGRALRSLRAASTISDGEDMNKTKRTATAIGKQAKQAKKGAGDDVLEEVEEE
jgi:hypothetical protein